MVDERISIAPMMEWTDPHFRALMRGITKRTVLYTEMVVDDTVLHSPSLDFYLGNYGNQHPSVIQLGGSDPNTLAQAAELCERYGSGYGEINLNCGCPSQRVAKKCFGAKLMLQPDLVRQIVSGMSRRVSIPVTVKCRIGADDMDSYEELTRFISEAHQGGANKFVIHSRKCLLSGLTTKQNREVPPLRYEVVHRLVKDFPELQFVLNGGINTISEAQLHMDPAGYQYEEERLPAVHGVMIGRAAYSNPLLLCNADSTFYGEKDPCLSRRQILQRYIDYCEWCQSEDGPQRTVKGRLQTVTTAVLLNPMRNVINGIPHVQKFRMALNDLYVEKVHGMKGIVNPSPREIIEGAMEELREEDLDEPLGNNLTSKEDSLS